MARRKNGGGKPPRAPQNPDFAFLASRIDALGATLTTAIARVEVQVAGVKGEVAGLKGEVTDLKGEVAGMRREHGTKLDLLAKKIDPLRRGGVGVGRIVALEKRVSVLEEHAGR